MSEGSRKYSNSIVCVEDVKSRKEYVLNNYTRLENEYNKFKTRYNYYHLLKEILEIIFILIGSLTTIVPVILSSFDFLEIKVSNIIVSIGAIESLITIVISKILNGKLIENTKKKMSNRTEIKDRLFSYFTKAMEDGQISLIEMIEIRKIIHQQSQELLITELT